MSPAMKAAIQTIMQEIGAFEGREMGRMRGGSPEKVETEVEPAGGQEDGEMCPACAAGTCDDPDHLSDDEAGAVSEMT